MPVPPIAYVWFKKKQYNAFKELCKDGPDFPETYAAWLSKANEEVAHFRARGETVHKVIIDITEFKEWCTQWLGQKFDAESRNRFASLNI